MRHTVESVCIACATWHSYYSRISAVRLFCVFISLLSERRELSNPYLWTEGSRCSANISATYKGSERRIQQFCDIQHNHSSIDMLVHFYSSFSQMNHHQVCFNNLKKLTCKLSNISSGYLLIRNKSNIHSVTQTAQCFFIDCVQHEFLNRCFFNARTCKSPLFGVELNAWNQKRFFRNC